LLRVSSIRWYRKVRESDNCDNRDDETFALHRS
jgi:hypothetical protein